MHQISYASYEFPARNSSVCRRREVYRNPRHLWGRVMGFCCSRIMYVNCILPEREKMIFFIVLPLLALLHNSLVNVPLMSASFNPFIAVQRRHINYLSFAVGLSSTSQASISSPTPSTLPTHHHHGRPNKSHQVPPSPSATPGCGLTCSEPLTSAPFGSPCACVLPMKVRLLLGVSVFAIYPQVTELEIEVAFGTYLKPSQVAIAGVVADNENQGKSVVDIDLIPLGDKFDNTTITLTYQRFWQKKVHLNRSLFGDYDVLHINYSGIPDLPYSDILPGGGPTRSTKNHQNPIAADYGGKNGKRNRRIMSIVALSTFVLLVVSFAAVAVVFNCRKVGMPSSAVSLVFTPPMNKRFGKGSLQTSSPTNSTSASFVSSMPASVLSVKTFSVVELEKATENFSSEKVLGEGGFGRVYHGIMENGAEVAVKLLKTDNQDGDCEFIAEIKILSRLHHRNLVKLIGICIEEGRRCLVYELVPNGSVESHLHGADRGKGTLDWEARLKIALGAARGLAYLHEDSNPHVIHRDFKASNVLLEDDFTPKVSDFGLAREATEGSNHISTRVMGTFGYVAPEYAMTGHLLVKSDVYSYGVVLLELLTGRKPVDMSQSPGQEHLVTWARPLLTDPEALDQLVDPALAGTYNPDDMAKLASIASMCVRLDVSHRPFMGEVVQALKLICRDTGDETCGDIYSPDRPSIQNSDLNGDFVISDGSWWNAGCLTPGLGSPFVTMEYSSGSSEVFGNAPGSGSVRGGVGLPRRYENRSGPLRVIRNSRDYYRLRGSVSEHKRDLKNGCGYEASF